MAQSHPPIPKRVLAGFRARLSVVCLSAAAIWNCAAEKHPGIGPAQADSTVFHVPALAGAGSGQDRFFQQYQTRSGWSFTAVNPVWLEVPGERTEKGFPVRTL